MRLALRSWPVSRHPCPWSPPRTSGSSQTAKKRAPSHRRLALISVFDEPGESEPTPVQEGATDGCCSAPTAPPGGAGGCARRDGRAAAPAADPRPVSTARSTPRTGCRSRCDRRRDPPGARRRDGGDGTGRHDDDGAGGHDNRGRDHHDLCPAPLATSSTSTSTSTTTTTSTSTSTTTTTTPVRVGVPGPVTLGETGLQFDTGSLVRFGQADTVVLTAIGGVLGEPDSDSDD